MSVPPPPPRDRRQIRYPLRLVVEARQLAEAGWTATQIIRRFKDEHGVVPSRSTVLCWIDPAYSDSQRTWNSRSYERRTRGQVVTPLRAPRSEVEARMVELRSEHGLSYNAISTILEVYHGVQWSAEKVRYICTVHLGLEKNPNKSRAMIERSEGLAA